MTIYKPWSDEIKEMHYDHHNVFASLKEDHQVNDCFIPKGKYKIVCLYNGFYLKDLTGENTLLSTWDCAYLLLYGCLKRGDDMLMNARGVYTEYVDALGVPNWNEVDRGIRLFGPITGKEDLE